MGKKLTGESNINTITTLSLNAQKDNVKALLGEQRIVCINLQLTPEEKDTLNSLKIDVEGLVGNFLYWGSVKNTDLLSDLKLYLGTIGKNNNQVANVVSRLIIRITRHIAKYFDTEFVWIETKTFLTNNTFIVPRWHIDNKFFKPHTAYKLVWAIRGPQTRFGTTKNFLEFERLTALEIQAGHGTRENIQARKEIDQIVNEIRISEKANAVLYRSGGKDPIIHSEPNMNKNRLFLAVVPGTKEEINEWYERKKQKDVRKNVKSRQWHYYAL